MAGRKGGRSCGQGRRGSCTKGSSQDTVPGVSRLGSPLVGKGAGRRSESDREYDTRDRQDHRSSEGAASAGIYKQAAAAGRGGEAAAERVRLMERILELQR